MTTKPFINFKSRSDVVPSTMIVLSILILLATLAFMIIVPSPSAAGIARGRERSRLMIQEEIDLARSRAASAREAADVRVWEGSAETVMAQVLARLSGRAARGGLQVSAFRPQRTQTFGTLTELPFSVQVAGPYASVLSFAAGLEEAEGKMVLRSLQVAAADGASSTVTSSLGISVYVNAKETPAAAPPATGGKRD